MCNIGPPAGATNRRFGGGSLRAFRMATGVATSRAKTSTTIGRKVVFGCNIGCNIRASVMLHRFLAPDGGFCGVAAT